MTLNEVQKAWLVNAFACYGRTTEVLRAFTAEFGVAIPKNQACRFDLSGVIDEEDAKRRGVRKWLKLWRECRKRFEDSVVDIPIANKAYRIKQLDTMFDLACQQKRYKSAAQLLEQAAKECGGVFSNVRKVDAAIAGKVDHEHTIPEEIRDASLAENIRAAVASALEQSLTAPAPTIQ